MKIVCLVLYPIFKIKLFGLLVSNFLSSLEILDIGPLSEVVLLVNISCQSVGTDAVKDRSNGQIAMRISGNLQLALMGYEDI